MRVLVIANLPPYVLGGAENQVARLVETWAGLGHHVEVAGHRIPDGTQRIGNFAFRTHRIAVVNCAGRTLRAASYFISLTRLLARIKGNADIIYCRGLGDAAVSVCLLKAIRALSLPLLVCPINARGSGDAHFIRSIPGWRGLLPIINRHCNAINIIAPAILSDLLELGIERPRIAHIPNGIAVHAPVTKSHVSPIRRMVWTGRLTAQKGLDILLKALEQVSIKGRQFNLEIIGEGPKQGSLIELTRTLGLDKFVCFRGALPRDAIRAELVNADVFVLPSRYEGMSNSALEAMEAGLPLLLTCCGGIDTWLDDSIGWLCEPGDVQGLTDALLRMFAAPDEKLLAMGRRARGIAERKFSIEKISQQNADLLQELSAAFRR